MASKHGPLGDWLFSIRPARELIHFKYSDNPIPDDRTPKASKNQKHRGDWNTQHLNTGLETFENRTI